MTCAEIIARVDELEPNQYSTDRKMEWLSNLDDKLLDECILTHRLDKTGREAELMLGTCPLPPYKNPDSTLLLADRYGVELYSSYLQMMIAKENSERARYNDERAVFLAKQQEFYDYFNRTHRPLTAYGKTSNRHKF